jgi:hypothetical protein
MAAFSSGIPRWLVLTFALVAFATIPPEALRLGPDICLWKHLFGLSACPACGSTRALVAFFHGHLTQALAYNRNIIVTGPMLVGLLVQDLVVGVKAAWERLGAPRQQSGLSVR